MIKKMTAAVCMVGLMTGAQAQQGSVLSDVYETTRDVVRGLTFGEEDLRERGVFTDRERDIILRGILGEDGRFEDDEFKGGKGPKKLPPGLQKKVARGGDLPPGWKKKFARGEVVSDDVYAARQGLPRSVIDDIRNIDGTEVIQVDDQVARVIKDTRTIIDVIDIVQGR
ncbi:MAG: hypothetical protein R3194_07815 [Limnobacter sp.]|nr:hypothetical protein [Limnobacter sp.]